MIYHALLYRWEVSIYAVSTVPAPESGMIQRMHVPFESLTFSVARELKLRDGFH